MKYFIPLFMLLFLVSCGKDQVTPAETPKTETAKQTAVEVTDKEVDAVLHEIEDDLLNISEEDEAGSTDSEIIKTTYKNPKGNVNMEISYSLDADEKIASIQVSASNYDLEKFSKGVQEQAIGKTLEEAADIYVSGSSLTTEAYQKAMKDIK